jgi:type I restriction enzyme, R subunit
MAQEIIARPSPCCESAGSWASGTTGPSRIATTSPERSSRPQPRRDESAELRAELDRLKGELAVYRESHAGTAKRLQATEAELRSARQDQAFWEQMASEAETAKAALAGKLATLQETGAAQSAAEVDRVVAAADAAAKAVDLDEADTRQLIDDQLRAAGWEVDTERLKHSQRSAPRKGQKPRDRRVAD